VNKLAFRGPERVDQSLKKRIFTGTPNTSTVSSGEFHTTTIFN